MTLIQVHNKKGNQSHNNLHALEKLLFIITAFLIIDSNLIISALKKSFHMPIYPFTHVKREGSHLFIVVMVMGHFLLAFNVRCSFKNEKE